MAKKHQCIETFVSHIKEVSDKYLKAFTLFYNCHKLYDSSSLLSEID